VTIYKQGGAYRIKVDGIDKSVGVIRLRWFTTIQALIDFLSEPNTPANALEKTEAWSASMLHGGPTVLWPLSAYHGYKARRAGRMLIDMFGLGEGPIAHPAQPGARGNASVSGPGACRVCTCRAVSACRPRRLGGGRRCTAQPRARNGRALARPSERSERFVRRFTHWRGFRNCPDGFIKQALIYQSGA
jgi:hypothetical protein